MIVIKMPGLDKLILNVIIKKKKNSQVSSVKIIYIDLQMY